MTYFVREKHVCSLATESFDICPKKLKRIVWTFVRSSRFPFTPGDGKSSERANGVSLWLAARKRSSRSEIAFSYERSEIKIGGIVRKGGTTKKEFLDFFGQAPASALFLDFQ